MLHHDGVECRRLARLAPDDERVVFFAAGLAFGQNRVHRTGFHAGGKGGRCCRKKMLQVREQAGAICKRGSHFQNNAPLGDAENEVVMREVIATSDNDA